MTRPTFAELLRHHRVARGLTRAQLAAQAGVNEDTVGDLERAAKRPRPATVGVLARALGLAAGELEAFRVAADDGAGAAGAGPAAGPSRPRGGLRRGASSFVGRERDVAAVRRRLGEHRLVTLTGPGGVGKTRLAVEVALGLAAPEDDACGANGTGGAVGAFPDGVWLTELAPLTDADLVPRAIAGTVGVELDPDAPPGDALADALGPRRLLLLLDNCEHLVDACAALAETLLGACPGLRLLVTGREPLGCDGEAVVRVPSLALPPVGGVPSLEEIGAAAAVRLFVDRAEEVAPGFALTARNAPAVAEVCRRLDGIPLALEFAARLVRGLPVEAVAARLDDRFRLLTGGRRTALGRQQTLKALVDWSYDLLTPAERVLFVRLSVFAGAFTLAAAEAVGGEPAADAIGTVDRRPGDGVLALLLRLVDTSFVLTDGSPPEEDEPAGARYRLLETLREYGRERLVADPEEATRLRDRHLAYHLGLIEAAAEAAGQRQALALRRLEAARDDLWAALGWARDREDAAVDGRLGAALTRLADRLASPPVGRALTPLLAELRRLGLPAYAAVERRLLAQTDPATLDAGADLFWVIGDWPAEAAVARRREEVQAAGAAGRDAPDGARARLRTARPLLFREGPRAALRLLTDLAGAAEASDDEALLLDVRLEEGYAHWHAGACESGRRVYAEALALLERLRPRLGEAAYRARRLAGLRGSGLVEHNADANARCLAFHEAALALARSSRDGLEEAMARANRADGEWGCRRYGKALQGFDEALATATAASFARVRSACVLGRGIVLGSLGRYDDAARSLAEGLATFRDLGDGWLGAYGLTYLGAVRAGQGDLDAALAASREAADLAERRGVGYPLALARVHLLWQEEVRAPGAPERGPRIEAALREAQGLGLCGLAVYLAWVRLLHRAADPAVPDDALAAELAAGVRRLREAAPLKGAWELLGLQVLRVLRERRPGLVEPAAALEGLVEEEIGATERSLDPDDRRDYRATRRPWDDLR